MATIPKRVTERLAKETRRFQKVLQAAKDRDINESDTVVIVTDLLSEVFGFDKYADITSEYAIRGTYCDLAIKVDDKVKYLIEVKAIGLGLKESHLRQAVGYGAQHGIQWVVLTNGVEWELYRIKFERPVDHDLICTFNFLELSARKKEDQGILFLLCKEGLAKAVIEEFHEHIKSVNKFMIGAILQSEVGINMLRRELRRVSPKIRVELDEIKAIVQGEVLKRDVVEGVPAEDAKAQVKKAAGRTLVKRSPSSKQE
jgi:hypothetical protein